MYKKIFPIGISVLLCAVIVMTGIFSVSGSGSLSGENYRKAETIKYNGRDTGVVRTEIKTPSGSKYGLQVVNTIEFDLANRNLTVEALNNGTYLNSLTTVKKAAGDFTSAANGKTVLAAVNGDLYMTAVHSHSGVNTDGTFYVPRGVQIIDGEIWCSQEIDQENLEAKNEEKGNPASPKYAFGVTSDYQPIVGIPKVRLTLKNTTRNTETTPDGLNRLPANNSLIVYNRRVADTRALTDAVEVEVQVNSDAFRHGSVITGKVTAVYPSGQGGKATIAANKIVLTARGNKMSTISGFKVGDEIKIETSINSDKNQDLWRKCISAIGGHMPILIDGSPATQFDTSKWPYTLIGYKDDGSVMITVNDGRQKSYSVGVAANQLADFCRELGYNTVFWFDGGGSTTLVTNDESGKLVVRNKPSDGNERAVANSLAVCWTDTQRAAQGSMDHIKAPVSFDPYNFSFGKGMDTNFNGANNVSVSIESGNVVRLTATSPSDPYVSLNFTNANKSVDTSTYGCIVMRLRTKAGVSVKQLQLFYCAGAYVGANEANSTRIQMDTGGQYKTYIIDLKGEKGWSGKLNSLRLDIFDGSPKSGDYVEISNMGFAKNKNDAEALAKSFGGDEAPTAPPTPAVTQTPGRTTPPATQTPQRTQSPAPATSAPVQTTSQASPAPSDSLLSSPDESPDINGSGDVSVTPTNRTPDCNTHGPSDDVQSPSGAPVTSGITNTSGSDSSSGGQGGNTALVITAVILSVAAVAVAVIVFILIRKSRRTDNK